MKAIKKISSILLAMIMLFAIATTTFAANTTGTITVNTAAKGETYSIYKMLDLSVNDDFSAYRYTVVSAWENFFKNSGAGAAYVDIDKQGYVTWKSDKKSADDLADFGKLAAKFASDNSIDALTTKSPADNESSVTFNDLAAGYYLITSTLGTKVIVQTTPDNPDPTINEKNPLPTIDKEVKEDSTSAFGEANTAQIGDTVEFKTIIHAKSGAKSYVLHDKMDAGFTLNQSSIEVKVGISPLTKDTDYTVSFTNTDSCSFEITFTQTYLDTITADTDIIVTYSAVLNDKAAISTATNDNQTWLTFGGGSQTSIDTTKTSTFKFDLVKTKNDNTFLSGAKFKLYDAKTGGNEIKLVKEADGSYRVATATEIATPGFTAATIEAGTVVVKGLDSDAKTTYWLEELEAPVGYNKLEERVEIKMNEGKNLDASTDDSKWLSGGVHVVNNTGDKLPSTGGIGTTIFYIVGSVLIIGAVVLLITKKRMSKYEVNAEK